MECNEILKALREDKDFSQCKMAEILGSTQKTVSNWEKGYNEPSYDMLLSYAKYFHVSVDYLLGISKNPQKSWLEK